MFCSKSFSRSFRDSLSSKFKNIKQKREICRTVAYRTEQRRKHAEGKTRELEQRNANKRQKNIVGTQRSLSTTHQNRL